MLCLMLEFIILNHVKMHLWIFRIPAIQMLEMELSIWNSPLRVALGIFKEFLQFFQTNRLSLMNFKISNILYHEVGLSVQCAFGLTAYLVMRPHLELGLRGIERFKWVIHPMPSLGPTMILTVSWRPQQFYIIKKSSQYLGQSILMSANPIDLV